MGSLSRRLGQLASRSIESDSSKILRTIRPNKIPNSLSQKLDTTLKDSHDMKVFGLGTLASMSNKERFANFTHALYGVYSTMEDELDRCCDYDTYKYRVENHSMKNDGDTDNEVRSVTPTAVAHFWNKHSQILRRADKLKSDVLDVSDVHDFVSFTPATQVYVDAIRKAGAKDRKSGSARLLGHAYTRYLADLMGGQVLGYPTQLALGLDGETPQQYTFAFPDDRRTYVESIYRDLNEAGDILMRNDNSISNEHGNIMLLDDVVSEARSAFEYNIKLYSEDPIYLDSLVGLKNITTGWLMNR